MVPVLDSYFILKLIIVHVLNYYFVFKLVLVPVLNNSLILKLLSLPVLDTLRILKLVLVPDSFFSNSQTGTGDNYLYRLQFKGVIGLEIPTCLLQYGI